MRHQITGLLLFLFLAIPVLGQVVEVGPIGMTVQDLDRSVTFFTEVLDFKKVKEWESKGAETEHLQGVFGANTRSALLRLGNEEIELTQYLAPRGNKYPWDTRANDRWFQHIAIVVDDMEEAYSRLRAAKVEYASTAPQLLPDWNPNAGGIKAFYFRDPDGHFLELIYFPKGKGDPKWQRPSKDLFLGIDHTAIVVKDTEKSLRFYRDKLGFKVAGSSENYGIEQERLNNVFGAHLLITGLRASKGPGIEFLQYLAPTNGRPYPADSTSNDLLHWQTSLKTKETKTISETLKRENWISSGVVGERFIIRDPDGHPLVIDGR